MSNQNHFVQLHLHTEYSLLDGAIKIKDLVKFAKEQNWRAVGISDHGNVFGAVKFFKMAQKEAIKPILGSEMYFCPDTAIKDKNTPYHHILLIVQNKIGYKNLCQLMAFAYQEGFYFKPRVDYKILQKHADGLIVGTACVGGHIPTLLREGNVDEAKQRTDWFLDVFGKDRFYFEIMPPDFEKQKITNDLILKYSEKWDVNLLATNDAHYLRLEDNEAHEVLLAIQTKKLMEDPDRMTFGDCKAYIRTEKQMLDLFPNHEQAIWNTGKVADMCDFNFEFGKLFFPNFPVPENETQESHFKKLCIAGLEELKRKSIIPKDKYEIYDQRLTEEVNLITKMGFVGYFLVVGDFIKWALNQGIPVGPGRGSAAGSLVAWTMKITNVDPIKYNLLFERFLNPERISMPDIDIDFCIEQREDVINYVKEKYGHECVCQIITFGTMMAKGVVKDVARSLGFPFQDANAITDLISNQLGITLSKAIEQEPRLKDMIENNPSVSKLMELCLKLEGLTRHASKHAAGVVIAPEPLKKMLPLYVPSKTNELVTQYAMTELESVGFLKMDFLGLKNLTVIERTLKAIEKNHSVKIDLDTMSMNDQKAFDLLRAGETAGIFQFESEGIREVLRKLQPDKFEDLIAVNALYRPGPLGSGMVDDFIERRHGRKKTTYMFPELEPILKETYGVIVYQEQVMKIASAIAGYTLGGSDILRRAMGKKKVDVMAEHRKIFVTGAKERDFDAKKAEELFELMAYFAGYGFNKSHSTAYALIAYHTAYLKANYPKEFMSCLISYETNDPDKMTFYLQEISHMGIKTISPNINRSNINFSAHEDGILFGLKGIKNVGLTALENIIAERNKKPFIDILDFCKRVDLRTANKRVIESLTSAGALDSLPGNRAQKTNELDKIIALANRIKEAERTGQMQLFGALGNGTTASDAYTFAPCEEWKNKEKLEKEKEVVGFYLSSHPLDTHKKIRKKLTHKTFEQALKRIQNFKGRIEPIVTCCGLKQSIREIKTKKGDRMAFAQFEDFSGTCEVVIFPRVYKKVEEWLEEYDVFVIKGSLDATYDKKCKIKANELVPIELVYEKWPAIEALTIELPSVENNVFDEDVKKITGTISPGKTPLNISFYENGQKMLLRTQKRILCNKKSIENIESAGFNVKLSL
jgi:DNA polymerase-3 subunit alpha